MSRYINECNAILRNLSQEVRARCSTDDQYCCYLHCCFLNRQHKEVWETWYFWFGLALIGLLMFTSVTSFLVGMCKKKRHQLIRVHHAASPAAAEGGAAAGAGAQEDTLATAAATVTAVTGPDGLIQPYVEGGLSAEVAARYKTQGPQGTATVILRGPDSLGADTDGEADVDDAAAEAVAGPLEPAYPPIQPVTIVHGPLPEGGYRQTETYTELVLPPGYMDAHPSHKHVH